MDLTGKVAIVTGGSRGIGRAIAEALAGAGARVAITARTEEDVIETADALDGDVHGHAMDVRDARACSELVERVTEEMGGLDILINNAGVGIFASMKEMSVEQWDQVLRTNLDGVFYLTRAAIPALVERGGGWIINIGSLAGKNAFPGGAAYNASKFGLLGFSEALMQDVRHDDIRVSCIMPGSVSTGGFRGGEQEWKIQPEDIGRLVLDLVAMPTRTLPSRVEVRPSRPPQS